MLKLRSLRLSNILSTFYLQFRFGMIGDAEIITNNTKVIDKILYKFNRTEN